MNEGKVVIELQDVHRDFHVMFTVISMSAMKLCMLCVECRSRYTRVSLSQ